MNIGHTVLFNWLPRVVLRRFFVLIAGDWIDSLIFVATAQVFGVRLHSFVSFCVCEFDKAQFIYHVQLIINHQLIHNLPIKYFQQHDHNNIGC